MEKRRRRKVEAREERKWGEGEGGGEREREQAWCARDVTHRVGNHRRKPSIASTSRNMRGARRIDRRNRE